MKLIAGFLLLAISCFASDPYPKNPNIAVAHYSFSIELNDTTNVIRGEATVSMKFIKPVKSFDLNLIGNNGKGQGMDVLEVTSSGKPVNFQHKNNLITISLPEAPKENEQRDFKIVYRGIPEDGLIIDKNKFGDRTFFGDNWPDRGRYWLPAIDHPAYKAPVDFIITAPEHYEVVATGKLIEESSLGGKRKLTHWRETIPVPVKVMTIGVARFAIELSAEINHIPITTWVYPQNRVDGFGDFSVAPRIFTFLQDYIGPYPYEKLAHVQSKTRWGGLENASNIFYNERTVNGKKEAEGLIAHETAHQWFGNSASEADWHHVWLSEGFATYFTALYMESAYGKERRQQMMKATREQVISFYKRNQQPIVDTTITDISRVLSTNTYQKAGWFLHMLRIKMSDEPFHSGIRNYYALYRDKNALTADFRRVMEQACGQDLKSFFQQWLYQGGHPQLTILWSVDEKKKELILSVSSTSKSSFDFPLELELVDKNDVSETKTLEIHGSKTELRVPFTSVPVFVNPDPKVNLLAEISVNKLK